jgi:hypothetical protein
METYRLETTVTKDGQIILPRRFEKMFSHHVEVIIKDKSGRKKRASQNIPSYSCGGKANETNFSREEICD